ncbi:MAG: bifunctional DNA-formamidopyrimidine glycosylase/DNA-(apurinic or apyrimidinic site) lyase [Beijerinckiaceae bacterium]|nr:bifunctional DNA-formamidopyrimidine glycosylase/DNA-(apurinic or apyrimidinic site) lyase [Beijerinckiaceae bacterium]
MPELPEVETVRRGLAPVMEGACLDTVELRRDGLRFPFPAGFADRLTGQRIETMVRRAKFIVAHLRGGEALIIHLGMTGRFIVEREGSFTPGLFVHEQPRHQAHDHVVFHLSNGARITYNDVRRFGFMDLAKSHALEENRHFKAMGVEPLGNGFNAAMLSSLLRGRRTPLKAALLDQRLISGLGNIYVCEALHRARLSPLRLAASLAGDGPEPRDEAERLTAEIRAVLEEAIAAGGSTLRDFAATDGALGYFQHTFRAYGQTGAKCQSDGCGGTIERIVQAGRSTFYCANCQT